MQTMVEGRRVNPLHVACCYCGASAGTPCIIAGTRTPERQWQGQRIRGYHDSRQRAAYEAGAFLPL